MPVLIGTDEAGYGPNLGPLVITATAWELPDGMRPEGLWEALSDVLTDSPKRGDGRLHVSDSKKVYSSGKPIHSLERSVLSFLRHLQLSCDSVETLGTSLSGARFTDDYEFVCGGLVDELALPAKCQDYDCQKSMTQLATAMESASIRLVSVQSCVMFAKEFNERVAVTDSKGKVLSAETLRLVRSAVDGLGESVSGWVVCDKHGGRNRYDDIISEAFDDKFVFRLEESGPQSRYRLDDLEFCFRTKAEALLPVALASMVSKYVREVVMMQFNRYWEHQLPTVKPTKGYPVDAKRFWDDIETKAQELHVVKSDIWRCR